MVVRRQQTVRWIARIESPSQGRLTGFLCWLFNIIAACKSHDRTFTEMLWQGVIGQLEVEYDFLLVWNIVGQRLLLSIYNAPYVTHLEFCFTVIWKSIYSPIYSKNCHEQTISLHCFLGSFHSSLSGSFILRRNDYRIYMT